MKRLGLVFLVLAGCSTAVMESDSILRAPSSASVPPPEAIAQDRYLSRIQPIFNHRCVVCHSCVDAPCQLQFTSYEAVRRGASSMPSLVGTRVHALPPTRMKDASSIAEWRTKGFFPVVPDGPQSERSLLVQFLERSKNSDLSKVPAASRETPVCSKSAAQAPSFGMPFGLPALTPGEMETLNTWVAEGAPGPSPAARRVLGQPSRPEIINRWESFLNQGTQKSQLVSRYVYEHVFLAHLHFSGTPDSEFYELIRSDQAPGGPFEAIHELVTPRPYDPVPSATRVYYRLKKITESIVQKTHIVWEVDDAKLQRLEQLFFKSKWASETVTDPGYGTSNPFLNFAQIPAESRARFMIENSLLIIESMIRGPVCTGRTATFAIRDHFWIFFMKPEADVSVHDGDLSKVEWPAMDSKHWMKHAVYRGKQVRALKKFLKKSGRDGMRLDDIWNGDGNNRNAVLTVLRHETNSSVYQGPIGGVPPTAWVLSFSNFERMYYNLVADFMPWGNLAHRMTTWMFMSFLRTEAEERFLQFLPEGPREQVRSEWNRGIGAIATMFQGARDRFASGGVAVNPQSPKRSLIGKILDGMTPTVLGPKDPLNGDRYIWHENTPITSREEWEGALSAMTGLRDTNKTQFERYLPNTSVVVLRDERGVGAWTYTLVANRGYKFNNQFLFESISREPEDDTFIAFRGVVGSYPELFYDVPLPKARKFMEELTTVKSLWSWREFKKKYAMRRWDPKVWGIYDRVSVLNDASEGPRAGILDLGHYDLDDQAF